MDAQIKQNDDVYIGFNLFELIAAEFSEGYEKEWREQLLDVGKVSVVCTLDEIVESFSSTKDIISTGDRLGLGVELLWEELHARCWSETLPVLRSLYGKICTLQILTLLLNVQVSPSLSSMSHQYAEKFAVELNRLADLGILLGDEQSRGQLLHILDVVIPSFAMKTIGVVNHRKSNTHIAHNRKRAREHLENSLIELPSSSIPLPAVHIVEDLDLTTFYEEYMIHQKPVLLTSSELIQQWPAMQTSGDCDVHKWADVNYLLAGKLFLCPHTFPALVTNIIVFVFQYKFVGIVQFLWN